MSAWLALAVLSTSAAPPPIQGCSAALAALHDAPDAIDGPDLERLCSAPLAADLPRLPSARAALDAVDKAHSGDLAEAREQLQTTLVALCAPPPPVAGAAPTVDRAALRAILDEPAFQKNRADGPALSTILERLWDVIKESLYTQESRTFSLAARGVFLIFVAIGAAWLALKLRKPKALASPRALTPEWRRSRGPSPEDLARKAAAALEAGELIEAMRLEMAALRAAAGADRGDDLDAQTDREWTTELKRRLPQPSTASGLDELVRTFERAFYGGIASSAAEAAEFQRAAETVRRSLIGRASA